MAQREDKDEIASSVAYLYDSDSETDQALANRYFFPMAQYITIYSAPDVRSKVFCKTKSYADTLRVMEILSNKPSKFKNVYGIWCKVSFPLNGKRYIGYVPSQFLSGMSIRDNNLVYLVSLAGYTKAGFECSLKILRHYQLIYEYKFSPVETYSYNPIETDTVGLGFGGYMYMTLKTGKGLKNVDRMLSVYSGEAACGYSEWSKLLFIKDNKVTHIMDGDGINDGGEVYDKTEYFFPSESGEENMLIKKYEELHYISDTLSEKKHKRIALEWDGASFKQTDSTSWSEKVRLTSEKEAGEHMDED